MFLENDNLFIQILITIEICLTMDEVWLELTLIYVGKAFALKMVYKNCHLDWELHLKN